MGQCPISAHFLMLGRQREAQLSTPIFSTSLNSAAQCVETLSVPLSIEGGVMNVS